MSELDTTKSKMTELWMIINDELEQVMDDENGFSLSFSSSEEAERYMQEHGFKGTVVLCPNITDGIP